MACFVLEFWAIYWPGGGKHPPPPAGMNRVNVITHGYAKFAPFIDKKNYRETRQTEYPIPINERGENKTWNLLLKSLDIGNWYPKRLIHLYNLASGIYHGFLSRAKILIALKSDQKYNKCLLYDFQYVIRKDINWLNGCFKMNRKNLKLVFLVWHMCLACTIEISSDRF